MKIKFAAVINCVDGRVQEPAAIYMKENYSVDFVDKITEGGPCKVLADNTETAMVESIKRRLEIAINCHEVKNVAIVGHHDCAANPTSKEEQIDQIKKSQTLVKSWNLGLESITGLWIGEGFNTCEKVEV